jgi:hypothetical protein
MEETWRGFATAHYKQLKVSNPKVTFKEALKSAGQLYREQKNNLYQVRGKVVQVHRQKGNTAKADRVEAQQYGGILRNLEFDFTYGDGLFEDDLRWSAK